MNIIPIDHPKDPRVADYRGVRDGEWLRDRGLFIAEGRFIARRLLAGGVRFEPRSALLTDAARESLADVLPRMGGRPVYVAPPEVLNAIGGFDIHRGCLVAGERGGALAAEELLDRVPPGPATIAVLDDLTNHDNVGGIFRNAAAFGAAGVLLAPGCCDPLYRKAIRVSMGACLSVPFARLRRGEGADAAPARRRWDEAAAMLRARGFTPVALALAPGGREIDRARELLRHRAALLIGAEGPGLPPEALRAADAVVTIPIRRDLSRGGVDSLNAAVAAGIALHHAAAARGGA